jgi:murein DD-endopeptidase MepM/ murein hydrolase activator NlpD
MIRLKYPITGGASKISQPFGTNPDGFPDYYAQFGYKGHNGIDFYGVKNDPIFSVCGGKVTFASFDNSGFGNLTIITDDEGGRHYYAHQNIISVHVGEIVKEGLQIGYMGSTGNVIGGPYSDGTHLHYGYRPPGFDVNNGYGGFIDPMPYFEQEISQSGWAEIVCADGANVRFEPAGRFVTWFPQGVRVRKTGEFRPANGLFWERIDGGYWIARADSDGTVMLRDIE